MKATVHAFVTSVAVLYLVLIDWIIFKGEQI